MSFLNLNCPLCASRRTELFFSQKTAVNWELYGLEKQSKKTLDFFKCGKCCLVFKDPSILLDPANEKIRYNLHVNTANDAEYEEFLSSLVDPIIAKLKHGSEGLDFGCGVEPAMQKLFDRKGYKCESYDPYFHNEEALLKQKYDFITVCETAEHFYNPKKEFDLLFSMLKHGAWLGVKTAFVPQDFESWWYHRDPTHVVFYSGETFEWIAKQYNTALEICPKDTVLFKTGATMVTKSEAYQKG